MLLERSRDAWVSLLEGCCVSPVLELGELAEHPLHESRSSFESVLGIPLPRAGLPWRVDVGPAPLPGEHGVEIVESLGLDPQALLDSGVLGSTP